MKAAQELDASIPDDYWWSGSVSSKRGTNLNREDLLWALELCKKDKSIKFVIVDEPDRFMRSINEAAYFEVSFSMLGVTVWYASDPQLNKGDLPSKLLKFTKYLSAEGSNEERQNKSIAGQTKALVEGRYPFSPKPGYKKGYEAGIQELHEVRAPILKAILEDIAAKRVTPTEALIRLNASQFMKSHSPYKMDKFRIIVIDPFYAGIVEVRKQVNVRNEKGLHQPLITKDQHRELLEIMENKKKTQSGPRKNGNPKYPLSNIIACDMCKDSPIGRLVGYDHKNGRSDSAIYEKYRCRSCGRLQHRRELHPKVERIFADHRIVKEGWDELIEALKIVWKQEEGQSEQEQSRIKHKIMSLNTKITQQVDAVTDPDNASIKKEILEAIENLKTEVKDWEDKLNELSEHSEADKEQFLEFAYDFTKNMGSGFFDTTTSKENRLRCKQLIFPGGFYIDKNNKVYTTEVSVLCRLAVNKKGGKVALKSQMVQDR
jgi:DNA invertase Pin-like site-specific DNA recombinase